MARRAPQLVVDAAALPAIVALIEGAEGSIALLAFSFTLGSARASRAGAKSAAPSGPQQVLQALLDACGRGVNVRVYLEDERETAEKNRETATILEAAGAEVVYGTGHAKGLCVDEQKLLFGSTNLSHQSLTKNIETNLLFDDAEFAAGFLRYFEHLWQGGRHGGVTLAPPFLADGDFEPALIELIDAAKKRVDFSIYFFDHREIEAALVRAHARGVVVRGLVHRHATFALSYVRRSQATVRRLRAAGIDALFYGPPHLFTHSKWLVRDEAELFVSTANWLYEDVDVHPQLSLRMTQKATAKKLTAQLSSTIAAQATEAS